MLLLLLHASARSPSPPSSPPTPDLVDRLCPPAKDYANARSWPTTPEGCYNLSGVTDPMSLFYGLQIPAGVDVSLLTSTPRFTAIPSLFFNAEAVDGVVTIDTSIVTRMEYVFSDALAFNRPLLWDTSHVVTTMDYMFDRAAAFNQPLPWDT
jgi:hypothetical protein